jgi:hypothetical protein
VTLLQIKKIIKNSISPKYEMARDNVISFNETLANEYREVKRESKKRIKVPFGSDGYEMFVNEARNTNRRLYGNYDKKTKDGEKGLYDRLQDAKIYTLVYSKNYTNAQLKRHTINRFKEVIKETVESISNEIKKLDTKDIREGISEHDINFIITNKDLKEQSYTINTIVSGGDIQVMHYRTLKKLHKGIV